jgi:hypothetical protein
LFEVVMSGPCLSNDAANPGNEDRSGTMAVLISICGFLRVGCEILPTLSKSRRPSEPLLVLLKARTLLQASLS